MPYEKGAVFGNAGGGKSTLASRLADVTGLPLYPLDRIQFKAGGERFSAADTLVYIGLPLFYALQAGHEAPLQGHRQT